MSNLTTDPLEEVIRSSGEGWLIDWFEPRDQAISHLRKRLQAADEASRHRLGAVAPSLTAEALIAEHQRNPHKVRALLQVLPTVQTPDILVLVRRILDGASIKTMKLDYSMQKSFHLVVELEPLETQVTGERYESTDIEDAVILRHLGILKMGDQPVFDGFYPLNVEK